MDRIKNLPHEAQATLSGLILFIIFSFLDWQQVTVGPYTAGRNLWHGVGIITVLIAIAYLIWEIVRALEYKVELGQVTPGMTSAGFAIALLVFTVITFLDWSDFRHWPAWIGLLIAVLIAIVAFPRAKKEGVEMPKMPASVSIAKGGGGETAAAPPPPAAPPEAPPADDAGTSPQA
jgi:MFS family permease